MKKLKNWDNQTWLASKNYIYQFNKFLNQKVKFNKKTRILDIGCGRANIISALQKKYKFREKPIGLDVVENKGIKRNIIFKKIDAHDYLKRKKEKYDLILLKQTIHFFSSSKLKVLIKIAKKRLEREGKILIFSLKTKNNKIPCFKKMENKLKQSLKRDEILIRLIKGNLGQVKSTYFNFNVEISLKKYFKMVKMRYISCLLNFSNKEIIEGLKEIQKKYSKTLRFKDTLLCIEFIKK